MTPGHFRDSTQIRFHAGGRIGNAALMAALAALKIHSAFKNASKVLKFRVGIGGRRLHHGEFFEIFKIIINVRLFSFKCLAG